MLHIITLLAMATAIALGIYLAYFPYEEGFQYLAFILAILVPLIVLAIGVANDLRGLELPSRYGIWPMDTFLLGMAPNAMFLGFSDKCAFVFWVVPPPVYLLFADFLDVILKMMLVVEDYRSDKGVNLDTKVLKICHRVKVKDREEDEKQHTMKLRLPK
ncbi:hypothetical protein Tco_0866767 [Tanacetum coccineum]